VNARAATIVPTGAGNLEWPRRVETDRRALMERLPSSLVDLHAAVTDRAASAGAAALILSGSTARAHRTDISDLDYHVIGGEPIDTSGLSRELDLHVLTPQELRSELMVGDDFVQWSLRFGLVVFDRGPVRDALALIAERRLWPDAERKRVHAVKSLHLAHRFVATGDQDAALTQVRTALSLAARAYLLHRRVFPLSRAELPSQLHEMGQVDAAVALSRCIHAVPSLGELDWAASTGAALVDGD
jgi:hypothetical protein